MNLPADSATAKNSLVATRHAANTRQRKKADGVQQIRQFLASHPGQLWLMRDVAPKLDLSRRQLARQLRKEGISYRSLRDAELRRQALACLTAQTCTVADLADALGYEDIPAFRRAFRRWFGMTPAGLMASHYNAPAE